ncbi:MAG: tetratricopeptide repeat protein [Proteobacteria bacterium]|nr:tetratricopeptide repeat protein [Pseudomonadota bacterium]
MRGLTIVAIAIVCLVAYPACAIPLNSKFVSDSELLKERAALSDVFQRFKQNNANAADTLNQIQKVISNAAFEALTNDEQHSAYLVLGALQYDTGDLAGALVTLKRSSAMPEAVSVDWQVRLDAAYRLEDFDDCVLSLTKLATAWPKEINDISDDTIFTIAAKASKKGDNSPEQEALLKALFWIPWRPTGAFNSADGLWLDLARIELGRGDSATAQEAAELVQHPVVLITLRADRRFDAIVNADPARYDVAKASASYLNRLRAAAAAASDKLEPINALAEELIAQNRSDEALALVDSALAKAKQANAKAPAFSDNDRYINWIYNVRSDALWRSGNFEEALKNMAAGATLDERGGLNVSQAINLADYYNSLDRPGDALAAVAKVGNMSDYGHMALQEAKACAYAQLHDASNLAQSQTYLENHIADGPGPYIEAMLCIGDMDAAARGVVMELDQPDRRGAMLNTMQDYLDPPRRTPFDADMHTKWSRLKSRADIQAAVAKVGHIEKYKRSSRFY